jgi:hypothetical protein
MKVEEIKLAFESNQKFEFAVLQDIEKLLDDANAKRRSLQSQGLKVSEALNNLQADYGLAFSKAIDAKNKAKDLGAPDLEKLFGARADEAKDYQNVVGKASNVISSTINAI